MTQTRDPVDTYRFQRRLFALARQSVVEFAHEVGYYQPMNEQRLGSDFYRLAMAVGKFSVLLPMEQLHLFFEPAAAELLMRLPNRYWFWTAVYGAVVRAGVRGASKPIPQALVAAQLAEIHRIYAAKFNLRLAVAELSPSQVASRAVAGVLLVRVCRPDRDEVLVNPIFEPGLCVNDTAADLAAALTATLLKN